MRKRMFKQVTMLAMAMAMTIGAATTAMAAEWKQDAKGWWWQNDDGSYPVSQWQWLDGNGDGIAESYCFDASGYMYANTTTPDGYQVNADGQWLANGAVQTKAVQASAPANNTQNGTYSTSEYDNNGISLAALDMFGRTREENAKYGEVFSDANLEFVTVKYANDFVVNYSARSQKANEILVAGENATKIFKYADNSHTADGLVKTLKAKGYDCYSNGNTHIRYLRSNFGSLLYGVTVEFNNNGVRRTLLWECSSR